MTIQSVQLNNLQSDSSQNREVKPYREAKGAVRTAKRVKPLPPQGHLVDDNLFTGTKYFFKDIGYDLKSVKDGYMGAANDHQLGRLNDVGLTLGGIGIATYLATQTPNPKARLMEYIGLATFLTTRALYPKVMINFPARVLHGYDIDKWYIDDQGRKKSVHQDSNYIPYDMYNGKNKGEDLDAIGDRMGIPRDIKDRHEVIREQMRKVATQNNTLWMLTAGFATPLITALLCGGIEKFIVSPELEKSRNAKYNSKIQAILKQVPSSETDFSSTGTTLGESVKNLISKYEGKTVPKEEMERITELLTEGTDSILAEGIKADIENLLIGGKALIIDHKTLDTMYEKAGKSMQGAQTKYIAENILPSVQEVETLIKEIRPDADLKKGIELTKEEFNEIKGRILNIAQGRIDSAAGEAAKHKDYLKSNVIKFQNAFETEELSVLTKESEEKAIKFANIIGNFKKKNTALDKCANFKFEYTSDSVLANYYEKFQKTLIKQLGISPSDYKRISEDKEFASKLLDEKISALCKDEAKYKQTFEKLGKVLSDMETSLHGSTENSSHIKDLITGIENVYNSAANSLMNNGIGENTANRLVKGDLSNSLSSNEDFFRLLDGITENIYANSFPNDIEALRGYAKGKGSSKNLKISRLISRYQGEVNSFFRTFHTIDFYKRAAKPEELLEYASLKDLTYINQLQKHIKDILKSASIADFTAKLGVENCGEYRDLYNIGWAVKGNEIVKGPQNVIITESTKEGLEKYNSKNLSERLQTYIARFKNIIANDTTDFTRPNHVLDRNISKSYSDIAKTNEAKFNLVAQSPVDMIQKAAGKMHADRKWLKSVGIFTGIVLGITIAAQFCFGKIKNKHNLQKINNKQVKNETVK